MNGEKINSIQNAVAYLKSNLSKTDCPIFIELIGTPKSGKTTLVNAMKNLLEKSGIPVTVRRETAEYNPIQNKNSEEYNIWMIMELIKNFSEDLINNPGKIVIYDRGLLDRIPWIDYSVQTGSISKKDSEIIKKLYETDLLKKYNPLAYGFITSPEISIKRKGGEGRLVNKNSLKMFNEHFANQQDFIKAHALEYHKYQTDSYQGKLPDFITDVTSNMLQDSCRLISEKIKDENYR